MIDRCRQTHQSGPAGGGDGRWWDDQDHLGVHQREGDKVASMGGGINTQILVWISEEDMATLSDSPIFISDWHVDVREGYVEDYVCMMWGRSLCDVSFRHWLIASGERADGVLAQEENMEKHEIKSLNVFWQLKSCIVSQVKFWNYTQVM